MELKVVLVRHGFSVGNRDNLLSGWSDVPLTEEGMEELKECLRRYEYPETERYFASDLVRASHTAEILYPGKPCEKLPEFRETNFGVYDNKSSEEMEFWRFFMDWINDKPVEGGESLSRFSERILNAFNALNARMAEEGVRSYTLVSHTGVMRVIYSELLSLPRKLFFRTTVGNGLGFVLDLKKRGNGFELMNIEPLGSP